MHKKIFGLLIGSAMFMSQVSAGIPNGAIEYNGHYYYVYANTCRTWEQAKLYCESLGGHLAIIDSPEENRRVYQITKMFGNVNAYFGLTDSEHEGHWKWVNGQDLSWSNWSAGEPNNIGGREHYALFWGGESWNDGSFGPNPADTTFICEWDSDMVREFNSRSHTERAVDELSEKVNVQKYAQEVLKLVNIERNKRGIPSLRLSKELMDASAIRSREITELFSHTRPNGKPCQSLIAKGTYTVGENIAGGSPTPESVVELWMNSSGHRANILNRDYEELGVGYIYKENSQYVHYWVQMFKRPKSKAILRK